MVVSMVGPPKNRPPMSHRKTDSGIHPAILATIRPHGLTPDEYNAWVEVAKQSSYAEFAKDVPDGKALIDQALAVK